MRMTFIALMLAGAVGACTTQQDNATVAGAAAGAALGAAVSDDDNRVEGAVIGGVTGAVAGSLLGRDASGNCVYRRMDGTRFVAPCS